MVFQAAFGGCGQGLGCSGVQGFALLVVGGETPCAGES